MCRDNNYCVSSIGAVVLGWYTGKGVSDRAGRVGMGGGGRIGGLGRCPDSPVFPNFSLTRSFPVLRLGVGGTRGK